MANIFKTLICSNCRKYLSVFPIKVYPNRTVKCGRCNSDDDGGTVSKLYETLAEKLKFPCINCYEGCKNMLPPNEMKCHELTCIGTTIPCPICCEFVGHSFTVVAHFKQQHQEALLSYPQFVITFDDKNEDMFYLYASSTESRLHIIYVRYDHLVKELFFDITPFHIESLTGKKCVQYLELYTIHNKFLCKSCDNNIGNITMSIKDDYPRNSICRFFIEEDKTLLQDLKHSFGGLLLSSIEESSPKIIIKEVPKEIVKHISTPCDRMHFAPEPIRIHEPCTRQHFQCDPVMPFFKLNTGTHEISFHTFKIRSLDSRYSPLFYLANTSWKCLLKRHYEKTTPYLAVFIEKVDAPSENSCSYKLDATISLLSINSEQNVSMSFSDKIFGKRNSETMNWGFSKFLDWSLLLDPNRKYTSSPDYDIQIILKMTLAKIFPHKPFCRCSGC